MNIYVRRVDYQAINKQISILKKVVENFFDNKSSIEVIGKKSNFKGEVDILLATDPRLGGAIKQIIKEEGGMEEGDLLLFYKNGNKYSLEILKPTDSRYSVLDGIFASADRHLEFEVENIQEEDKQQDAPSKVGINKIYYGIPGCGKSYYVENTELKDVDKEHDVFRTTFYLDYSNSDFIGQIYPHVDENGNVSYIHVPGPFTKALERALTVEDGRMVYLIIEEINRGNAAAIFGDTFQLLDRVKEKTEGKEIGDSEYPISNSFIEGYFEKNKIPCVEGQIYIPHNLTIFATMNTSDQNVFPLDTAFKRRWNREMVSAKWENVSFRNMYVPGTNITWEKFCTTINKKMLEPSADSDVAVSEDKQIGAFFVQKNMLCENPKECPSEKLISFTGNIIDYLYNDVTKFDHSILFAKEFSSYNSVYDEITNYYVNAISEPNNNTNAGPFEKVFKREVIDELLNNKSSVEDLQDEQGNQN